LNNSAKPKLCVTKLTASRQIGGGKAFRNDLPNRLLMLLVYYRLYLTQEFMTLFFKAANKSLISRNITLKRGLLRQEEAAYSQTGCDKHAFGHYC